VSKQRKEWTYHDERADKWVEPYVSREELAALYSEGTINDYTQVINVRTTRSSGPGMGIHAVMYSHLGQSIDVTFDPDPEAFLESRQGRLTTVLSGPNNGGKTFLLKHIYSLVGHDGYLVACNRFSHVDVLNSRERQETEHVERYRSFIFNFESSRTNTEDNDLKLDQILTGLKDDQRRKLFDTGRRLLGNSFDMVHTDPENSFSPFMVTMDGENLRYGSSGTRLLLTLLGTLLDERFTTLLLDEPEIGLSPRIQTRLAQFLYDANERTGFCPHLNQLYVATHSHIFLDRSAYSNNFVVTKAGKQIAVRPIGSVSDLHQLQFNMLGNDLASLFLPSGIVIVEGESDVTFLNKVLELHLPDVRVAMVCAHGEGEVRSKLNFFKEAFGDVASSLYRGRLFVVFDKQISTRLAKIATQGVLVENTIVLSRNGIEQYYPQQLLAAAFHCDVADAGNMDLESDPIGHNGHRYSKKDLAKFVAERLTNAHALDAEIEAFVNKLRSACK
jgi:ABC-type branched-subunit amino acid transport system ATPase component